MRARRVGTTTKKGSDAEARAVAHLERAGYRVIGRNVRVRGGELDVVAHDGAVLCFVEVRSRTSIRAALESIDARKRARIITAARTYLLRHAVVAPCRFDVVVVDENGAVDLVRGAFEAQA